MHKSSQLFAAVVVSLLSSTAAWAQIVPGSSSEPQASAQAGQAVAPAEGSASGAQFEEIVVTARRRNENVSRVPLSIKAIGTAELEQRGIKTESDLQRSVPGLTVRETQQSNSLNYAIRGQTVDGYSSSHPGVLSYVNDVQMTSLGASSFFDIESVQVLKGPQGTLFGRNTTGGAVLFATAKPTNSLSGNITAQVGNYSLKEFEGHINIPLIEDKLLMRVAGRFVRRHGYEKNLTTGGDVGRRDLGTDDSQSGRVSLLFRPFDGFENNTMVQYSDTGGTSASGVIYSLNRVGTPGLNVSVDFLYNPVFNPVDFNAYVAANPQAFPGGIEQFLALQQSRGPYKVNFNSPGYFRGKAPSFTNTTTYDVGSNIVLKNIIGYINSKTHSSNDSDGTPYTIYNLGPFGQTIGNRIQDKQFSEELQLQGKAFDNNLQYIIGLYYSSEIQNNDTPQAFFNLAPNMIIPASINSFKQRFRSYAAFTQGTYDLSSLTGVEGLSLTGGFRYTVEKVRQVLLPDSVFYGGGPQPLSKKFQKPSWTAGLEYQATKNLLLYVTQRGSWRSGGFNGFKVPLPGRADVGGSEFEPETTYDVEIGAKFDGSIGERPFRASVAAYNQWAKSVQRVIYVTINGAPAAVTANVPKSEVTGVELDSQYEPLEWLTLGLGAAYTHARFTDKTVTLFGIPTTFGPYPDTPKFTIDTFAELKLPVPEEWGRVSLRGDLYHQSKFYFSSLNATIAPNTVLPSYTLVNFRLNWNNIGGTKVSSALFITNAFDKTFYTGGTGLSPAFGENVALPGRPRMYGVQLGVDF